MERDKLFHLLSEGNPNSLGNALEVYEMVLSGSLAVGDLYALYEDEHKVVSMRVSNILKRLWRHDAQIVLPLVHRFRADAAGYTNPTFRWTLAQIFREMYDVLTAEEQEALLVEVKNNLELTTDWIAITQSLETLLYAQKKGYEIRDIKPSLDKLGDDKRKAVLSKVKKVQEALEGGQ